jgi:hypothetical protein
MAELVRMLRNIGSGVRTPRTGPAAEVRWYWTIPRFEHQGGRVSIWPRRAVIDFSGLVAGGDGRPGLTRFADPSIERRRAPTTECDARFNRNSDEPVIEHPSQSVIQVLLGSQSPARLLKFFVGKPHRFDLAPQMGILPAIST